MHFLLIAKLIYQCYFIKVSFQVIGNEQFIIESFIYLCEALKLILLAFLIITLISQLTQLSNFLSNQSFIYIVSLAQQASILASLHFLSSFDHIMFEFTLKLSFGFILIQIVRLY